MKKIIVSILVIGLLLTTSIASVNAINCRDAVNEYDSTFFDELGYSIAWDAEKKEGGQLYGIAIDSSMHSIVVGMTDQNNSNARPIIVKYDEAGNELWSDVPASFNLPSSQVKKLKDFFSLKLNAITYQEIASEQLPQIQNIVFRNSYVSSDEYSATFTDVAIDSNNDYIVAAGMIYNHNTLKQDIYVVKYTPNGNVLWNKQLSFKRMDTNAQVVVTADGTIYVSSFSTGIDGGLLISPVIKIAKLSPLGQVKQIATYEVDIMQPFPYLTDAVVHPTTGNIWLVVYLPFGGGYEDGDVDNDFCLVEYTPNMEKIAEWQYDSGTSSDPDSIGMCDFPTSMVIDDDGNIIVAGWRAIQIDTNGYVKCRRGHMVKFSQSGDVLLDIEDCEIKEFFDVAIRNSISVPHQEIVATAANFSDENLKGKFVIFLYDGLDGTKILDIVEGSDEVEVARCVVVNPEGNLIVAGLRLDCIVNGSYFYNFLTRCFTITENIQSNLFEGTHSISLSQQHTSTSTTTGSSPLSRWINN